MARSRKLNKEEAITPLTLPSLSLPYLPHPFPSLSLPRRSRTPPPIVARRSGGALKLPQRVRAHLSHLGLLKTRLVTDNMTSDEGIWL